MFWEDCSSMIVVNVVDVVDVVVVVEWCGVDDAWEFVLVWMLLHWLLY